MAELYGEDLVSLPQFSFDAVSLHASQFFGKGTNAKRAYKMFVESFVHDYKVHSDSDDFKIKALCHRSMCKNKPSHTITVTLRKGCGDASVHYTSCTCAAGEAMCSHILAVLYCTAHYSILNLERVPPTVVATSLLQSWHHPRSEGFKQQEVHKVIIRNPCSTSRRSVKSTLHVPGSIPSWTVFYGLSNHLIQLNTILPPLNTMVPTVSTDFGPAPVGSVLSYQHKPAAELASAIGFPDLPLSTLLPIYHAVLKEAEYRIKDSLMLSPHACASIEAATRDQSDSFTWHKQRKCRLTASNFGRVCKRRADFDTLAKQLATGKCVQTAAMRRGIRLEPKAVELYENIKECKCFPVGLIISPTCPWIACTPDRRVYDPSQAGESCFGILEVKCPTAETFAGVQCLSLNDEGEWCLKTSHDYYFQMMGCLGITGLKWCDFVVLLANGACFIDRIHYNKKIFLGMQEKLEIFFHDSFLNAMLSNISPQTHP